jgi:hypothetical protein
MTSGLQVEKIAKTQDVKPVLGERKLRGEQIEGKLREEQIEKNDRKPPRPIAIYRNPVW